MRSVHGICGRNYRDKYMEDHIVQKSNSLLYVDELDEAQS